MSDTPNPNGLAAIRAALIQALTDEYSDVSSASGPDQFAAMRINPPCVLVVPGSPYLGPDSNGVEQVRYSVFFVPRSGDAASVLDYIDSQLDVLRQCLHSTSWPFVLETVQVSTYQFGPDQAPHTAAVAEVQTLRGYR